MVTVASRDANATELFKTIAIRRIDAKSSHPCRTSKRRAGAIVRPAALGDLPIPHRACSLPKRCQNRKPIKVNEMPSLTQGTMPPRPPAQRPAEPAVMISVCPSGCVLQIVPARRPNETLAGAGTCRLWTVEHWKGSSCSSKSYPLQHRSRSPRVVQYARILYSNLNHVGVRDFILRGAIFTECDVVAGGHAMFFQNLLTRPRLRSSDVSPVARPRSIGTNRG